MLGRKEFDTERQSGGAIIGRRQLMLGSAAIASASVAAQAGGRELHQCGGSQNSFVYLHRTEAEWRAMLTEEEYRILREGGTERIGVSPYSRENLAETYFCRGCSAALYRGEEYVPMNFGFVSFAHSVPGAVLTGVDETDLNGTFRRPRKMMEVQCRCCGSHLGHLVAMRGRVLHCINGTALSDAVSMY